MSEEIFLNLNRFENLAIQYQIKDETGKSELSYIKENISEIHKWVHIQKLKEENDKNNWGKEIKDYSKIVKNSIESVEDLSSGDHFRVMKGSLRIVTSIASVTSGPYGTAAVGICAVLSSILGVFDSPHPEESSPLLKFVEIVREEFKKHTQQNFSQTFSALCTRKGNLLWDLRTLQIKDATRLEDLKDLKLVYSDFPSFIGEIGSHIKKSFAPDSKSEDLKGWVWYVVLYCKACVTELTLLGTIIAYFKSIGLDAEFVMGRLEKQKKDSMEILGFLSDRNNMSANALLPFEGGKILKMMHVRQNADAYRVVEEFRDSLGLPKMPTYSEIEKALTYAKKCGVILKLDSYGHPHTGGFFHKKYFQFINHSEFPVKIKSGIVGDNIDGLNFTADVSGFKSYEQPIQHSGYVDWFTEQLGMLKAFSAGGYFVIYLDGSLMPDSNDRDGHAIKVIQFSLSLVVNIFGPCQPKISILDKTEAISEAENSDCYNQMDSKLCSPIYFSHNGKHYIIACQVCPKAICLTRTERAPTRTWRFILKEYDPIKDVRIVKECKWTSGGDCDIVECYCSENPWTLGNENFA